MRSGYYIVTNELQKWICSRWYSISSLPGVPIVRLWWCNSALRLSEVDDSEDFWLGLGMKKNIDYVCQELIPVEGSCWTDGKSLTKIKNQVQKNNKFKGIMYYADLRVPLETEYSALRGYRYVED